MTSIMGVGSILSLILYLMENPEANTVDLDHMPRFVMSDLGLHCLPMTPGKNGLKTL